MDVSMSKTSAPESPASVMSENLIKNITDIMTICGIESISAQRYSVGFGSRLHVTISSFANVPNDVKTQGIVVKDALATIMSVANIVRIIIKPSDEELQGLMSMWQASSVNASAANGGSGQSFDGTDSSEA